MFLTKVVSVVPIESLIYAISETDDMSIALKCSSLALQPSITLVSGLGFAMDTFIAQSYEDAPKFVVKGKTPSERSFSLMKEYQLLYHQKPNQRRLDKFMKKNIASFDHVNVLYQTVSTEDLWLPVVDIHGEYFLKIKLFKKKCLVPVPMLQN